MTISIQEPKEINAYLDGYNDGYEQGKYEILENLYIRIKEGGEQEILKIKDEIINKFEHGGQ